MKCLNWEDKKKKGRILILKTVHRTYNALPVSCIEMNTDTLTIFFSYLLPLPLKFKPVASLKVKFSILFTNCNQ